MIAKDHRRRILVLTGKRGGYGAMKPMLRLMRDDLAVALQLVATDQHLNGRFGATIEEIREEFELAATLDLMQADDTAASRAHALARGLAGMTDIYQKLDSELCVLYGDRGEVLVAAIAALHLGLPIAHIQGGDRSGSLDDAMRHALTKMAHLHFPATHESGERIRRMGEEDWRVHVVGDNHIDLIVAGEYWPKDRVLRSLDLDPQRPIAVVLQHSETTAPGESYRQMVETLEAVRDEKLQCVVVHPCSDAGYDGIIRAIENLAQGPDFRVRVNLDAPAFWGLLAISSVMIGNSSAGLIETPSFRLPAINIGRRQVGRLQSENVINVTHDRHAIKQAIRRALSEQFLASVRKCRQPFGDGRAGEKIVDVLRQVPLDRRLLTKEMTY